MKVHPWRIRRLCAIFLLLAVFVFVSVFALRFMDVLEEFDLHSPETAGPYILMDYGHNILVKYRFHGPPIRIVPVSTSDLHYIANELDDLTGGPETVVVFCAWAHFATYPMEIYIRRLQSIRRAVVRLLDRAPDTLVVIRTGNLKVLTLSVSISNSDWHSLQCDKVLKAVFRGLNVHLIDAWEMTLAHHLPHELHPPPPIIENMHPRLLRPSTIPAALGTHHPTTSKTL
ncbi:NXPE family member 3 [Liparis tanakae]|uniref:NXPE family member 3 n=1 Tax=Liparis tanakae TaxID=230148 RepID=A0A4Z2EKF2_9TELE|nr:NXPE family member 3 [Liparis tanakae]